MNIGVIGAGKMGSVLGTIWAQRGHRVLFSYSRDPQKLERIAQAAGPEARAATPLEAAQIGDVVFISVQPNSLADAFHQTGPLNKKLIITCVNDLRPDFHGHTMGLPTRRTISVAEEIADMVPGARVVEAFNVIFAELLRSSLHIFDPEKATIPYCGDEDEAKEITAGLISDVGFEGLDIGPLIRARTLESMATLWMQFAVTTKLYPEVGLKILHPHTKHMSFPQD